MAPFVDYPIQCDPISASLPPHERIQHLHTNIQIMPRCRLDLHTPRQIPPRRSQHHQRPSTMATSCIPSTRATAQRTPPAATPAELTRWMRTHPINLTQLHALRSSQLPWPPCAQVRYAIELYTLDPLLWPAPWNPKTELGWPPRTIYIVAMMLAKFGMLWRGERERWLWREAVRTYFECLGWTYG